MHKPRNIYRLLVLLTGLALAACGAEGREGSITSGSEGSDVTKTGLVNGEGVSGSAPRYGNICALEVRVEDFNKSLGNGTNPESHTLVITERSKLDLATNSAPTHVMRRGESYETDSGCMFIFDGVEPIVVSGILQEGVVYREWASPEGGY